MAKIIKVVTENDIGDGLIIENGKLKANVDGATIVVEGGKLVAKIPEAGVDLRVTAIKADKATGKLKVTVADAEGGNEQTVETTLADLVAISQEADNLAEAKDDGIYVGKAKVVEAIKDPETVKALAELLKGDELQGLDGTSIGYAVRGAGTPSDA